MDELEQPGTTGVYVKVSPKLPAACRRFKVDVSATCRRALARAVLESAGRELLQVEAVARGRHVPAVPAARAKRPRQTR
jgi:hypothetical protein